MEDLTTMTTEQSGPADSLAAPQQPDPDTNLDNTSRHPAVVATQLLATVAVAGGLGLLIIGFVHNWREMRTTTVTTAVSTSQALGRLNLLLPSTAEARAGCRALGGIPTWSPAGLTVFTMHGGNCSYMKPLEAAYLRAASHQGAEVIHSFPGRELPAPIRR